MEARRALSTMNLLAVIVISMVLKTFTWLATVATMCVACFGLLRRPHHGSHGERFRKDQGKMRRKKILTDGCQYES